MKKPDVIQRKTGIGSGASSKKSVPVCHYYERVGHIRPRCHQYLAAEEIDKKPHSLRSTKKVWVKKSDLLCNMAYTSSKADGKYAAGIHGELDISGVVVFYVPREVSEDAPEKVSKDVLASTVYTPGYGQPDVLTTRINTGRAGESSKKEAKNGRIPLFLVFLCLFLAKKGSTC